MAVLLESLPVRTVIEEFVEPSLRANYGCNFRLDLVAMTAVNLAGVCYEGILDPFASDFQTYAMEHLSGLEDRNAYDIAKTVFTFDLDPKQAILNACQRAHEALFLEATING